MLSLNMSINYIWFCYLHLSIFHIVKNFLIIINSCMVFHQIPYFFLSQSTIVGYLYRLPLFIIINNAATYLFSSFNFPIDFILCLIAFARLNFHKLPRSSKHIFFSHNLEINPVYFNRGALSHQDFLVRVWGIWIVMTTVSHRFEPWRPFSPVPLCKEEAEAQRVSMASPKAHGEFVTELEKQIHEYFSRTGNFGGSSNKQ